MKETESDFAYLYWNTEIGEALLTPIVFLHPVTRRWRKGCIIGIFEMKVQVQDQKGVTCKVDWRFVKFPLPTTTGEYGICERT